MKFYLLSQEDRSSQPYATETSRVGRADNRTDGWLSWDLGRTDEMNGRTNPKPSGTKNRSTKDDAVDGGGGVATTSRDYKCVWSG